MTPKKVFFLTFFWGLGEGWNLIVLVGRYIQIQDADRGLEVAIDSLDSGHMPANQEHIVRLLAIQPKSDHARTYNIVKALSMWYQGAPSN